MTRINTIKCSQDDPICVDNIRLLYENFEFIRRYWNSVLFSFFSEINNPLDTNDDVNLPSIVKPEGVTQLKFVIVAEASSSVNLTWDLTHNEQVYELDFGTIASGSYSKYEIDLDIESTDMYSYLESSLIFDLVDANNSVDYVFFGVYAVFPETNTELNYTPQIGTKATTDEFLHIANKLLNLHKRKHIAGFLGSNQCSYLASPINEFFIYHSYDSLDNSNSEEKKYILNIAMEIGTAGPDVEEITNFFENYNSTSTNTITIEKTPQLTVFRFSNNYVENDSYAHSTPYSSVQGYFNVDPARSDLFVKGLNLLAFDPQFGTNRKQGITNTIVDTDFFEIKQNTFIDYEKINAFGRAFFNFVYKRAGNIVGAFYIDSQQISLTTSSTEKFIVPLYQKNHWFVDRQDLNDAFFEVCMIVENKESYTISFSFNVSNATDTTSDFSTTISPGTTVYINEVVSIQKDNPASDFDVISLNMKSSIVANDIHIHSIVISPMLVSETY